MMKNLDYNKNDISLYDLNNYKIDIFNTKK